MRSNINNRALFVIVEQSSELVIKLEKAMQQLIQAQTEADLQRHLSEEATARCQGKLKSAK